MNVKTTIALINSLTNIVEVKDLMDTEIMAEWPRKMVIDACKLRMGELYALDFNKMEEEMAYFVNNDRTLLPEDADTEEIIRTVEAPVAEEPGRDDLLERFFNYLQVEVPEKLDRIDDRIVLFDLRSKQGFSTLSIKGEVYKANRDTCYKLMQDISKAAMALGATVSFHRPPRAQGFLKIVWKKNS